MLEQSKQTVGSVTKRIIRQLSYELESPLSKAALAKIRKTLGKPLSDATDILSLIHI